MFCETCCLSLQGGRWRQNVSPDCWNISTRMFLQTAGIFLPEYRFRSQMTFIVIIAVRNAIFTA
jgi:hypothetical protein